MSEQQKTAKDLPPVSEGWEQAFGSNTSGCYRVCEGCDRVYFDSFGSWDWEDGELEALKENAKKTPDKYIECDYSISTYFVCGKEIVTGCACNYGAPYEQWVQRNAVRIAAYLKLLANEFEARADELRQKASKVRLSQEQADQLRNQPSLLPNMLVAKPRRRRIDIS